MTELLLLKDELEIMNHILSHHVKAITKKLNLSVKFNKKCFENKKPQNIKINLYADIEKNAIYKTIQATEYEQDDYIVFSGEFDDPCLFYTYSIEWDFNSEQK